MALLLDTKYRTIVVEVITGVAFQIEAITRTEICGDLVNPFKTNVLVISEPLS